jgi:hypothetical protein
MESVQPADIHRQKLHLVALITLPHSQKVL